MANEHEKAGSSLPTQAETAATAVPHRTIHAEQLFQGDREVWIELDGVRYRLRITRRNRLILQK